jgi:O-antigen/teichoic acid export membrane protein
MISSVAVARMLGTQGYGEIGMVQSTLGLFGVFAGFGLGTTATKYIAEFRVKEPERAGRIAALTIVVALITSSLMLGVCVFFADYLSIQTLNHSSLAPLLYSGGVLLFFLTMGGMLSAALSGFESFKLLAKINVWTGVITVPTAIILVWLYGTQGAIASQTIIAALGLMLCAFALARECKTYGIEINYVKQIWREGRLLWIFSVPAMLGALVTVPAAWITNAMLVKQPDGFSELGLFNAANQWRIFVIFIPAILTSAMLPILSETYGRADKSNFIHTVSLNLRMTWVTAFPFAILVVLLSEPLAQIYGREFEKCADIIVVLMISCFLTVVNGSVGTALAGAGQMWLGSAFNFVWAIILIASSLLLVSRYGGFGLGLAYLTAYFFHTIFVMTYVELKLARSAISNNIKLILFSSTIMLFACYISLLELRIIFVRVVLILISFIPLIKMLFSFIDKKRTNTELI